MPTVLTHALAASAAARVYGGAGLPRRFWAWTCAVAMLPDLDVVGFPLGIRYGDALGHRGFTHSFAFAALVGVLVAAWAFPACRSRTGRALLGLHFTLASASHALLDALTDGGLGVALLSPFALDRYFFSVRPIRVSPIGAGFFSSRGLDVLASEALWVWTPAALCLLAGLALNRRGTLASLMAPVPDGAPARRRHG
ncbi:MAG: metal-dependent hydrolase [Vicinamibacterales bacterium]